MALLGLWHVDVIDSDEVVGWRKPYRARCWRSASVTSERRGGIRGERTEKILGQEKCSCSAWCVKGKINWWGDSMPVWWRWVRWNNRVWEKMGREEGLEQWDDKRGRRIKAWKNRQCQREVWEDQFRDILQRDTVLSLNGLSRSALPLASLGSFCTHPLPRAPIVLPHSPLYMPYMDHKNTLCPARHQVIGGLKGNVSGHMLSTEAAVPSLHESRGLRLFKVTWIITRELPKRIAPLSPC